MKKLATLLLGLVAFAAGAQVCSAQENSSPPVTIYVADTTRLLNEATPMIGSYPLPKIYIRWFVEIATCEKLNLPPAEKFAAIEYFVINYEEFGTSEKGPTNYLGMTIAAKNQIYLSMAHVFDRITVQHEFLHWLLDFNFPDGRYAKQGMDHPKEYFTQCEMHPY